MARFLQRLGGASARRPWVVILVWIIALAGISTAALTLQKPTTTQFEIPGLEFQTVLDDLGQDFPEMTGGTSTVVFTADEPFTDAQKAAIGAVIEKMSGLDHVTAAINPFQAQALLEGIGPDGKPVVPSSEAELQLMQRQGALLNGLRYVSTDQTAALAQVQWDTDPQSVPKEARDALIQVGTTVSDAGLRVNYSADVTQDIASIIGPGEIIGVVIAGIVLLVMLGSLLAAGLPILMALIGVGAGIGLTLAASYWVEMMSITPALGLMLGLAVGIDYALFILNRHRIQLLQGMDLRASIARAVGTAGNAVVFAGLTVIIALAALVLTGIPFLGVMGVAAAGTVLASVLVAITLTPALLSLIGARVMTKKAWARHGFSPRGEVLDETLQLPSSTTARTATADRGWIRTVTRHPWITVLATLLVLGAMSIPVAGMRLGLPDGASEPEDSTGYRTYAITVEKFGAGMNGPLLAVGTLPEGLNQQQVAMLQLETGEKLLAVDGVRHVAPVGVSEDGRTALWQLVPVDGPNSESTAELVHTLRDKQTEISAATGVDVRVTGQTVANIDISQKLADALPVYLLVVVGLSLVLLLLVFRSVLVPLIATGGFLLSIGAAMGAVTLVYQEGWLGGFFGVSHPAALLSFLPTILIGVLFGLAMDYQMFLVTGMREAWSHGQDARSAVVTGFRHGRRVVTAAALIMTAVFAGFVWAELAMIRPIGFGLAIGVLIDAFIVRMTLTPALLHLLGEKAWRLPRWLDRILPSVDVEGAALEQDDRGPAERLPA
ncbi:MMPL family transporter [Tessaracoccus sp. SD287]|uniref:MMPL family transporter n=1 Tax=Tessaracoccus sp. SD287 TaxID=2782008 RepID=UPI001A96192E|nr:MMPL family transporter [Tessaracoccus sp. SD287]MBO1030272.1 MMPL family transporter [Tessaracoccus sp. SD287]